ncbi:MAG: enoyl-CoA hydratase-related protein [Dehalococcoidia bacterium]|nr:enoyl-CoA hydratase-related protein [Dehalococcoidia bacterium]
MSDEEFQTLTYEVVDRVARVSLNRPRYKNAQSRLLLEEMDAAFRKAVLDPEVGVIVLRGEGDSFSAGHDLGTPEELADREVRPYEEGLRGRNQRSWDLYVDFGLRWRDLPKPTIAAVQGYCIFGGWMIASSMDVIFAADDAKLLPSKFQYFAVPWDLGARKAKEILFQGRFLSAEEACEVGFVNRVVPVDRLDDEVMAYARDVAEHDSFGLRLTKLAINQMEDIQGFTAHIKDAHTIYMLGAADTGGAPRVDGMRRLKGVQAAFERAERGDGSEGDA